MKYRKIELTVPLYERRGFHFDWEDGFFISTEEVKSTSAVLINANKEGLLSLAKHLIVLAQESVPNNYYIDFDDTNSLEEGSKPLIFKKTNVGCLEETQTNDRRVIKERKTLLINENTTSRDESLAKIRRGLERKASKE